jgi:hypothetical protein
VKESAQRPPSPPKQPTEFLAGVKPGAWTTGQLFGAAVVTDAIDAQVTVNGQPA